MKQNQPWLYECLQVLFADPTLQTRKARQEWRHGDRLERRFIRCSSELNGYVEWPGLGQVMEIRRVTERRGESTAETRYAITSLDESAAGAGQLLKLIRGHWLIENKLHWVRDVTFDEDRCTVRTGAAPRVLASLRNFAIGFLHGRRVCNIAAALRRNAAHAACVVRWVTQPFPG